MVKSMSHQNILTFCLFFLITSVIGLLVGGFVWNNSEPEVVISKPKLEKQVVKNTTSSIVSTIAKIDPYKDFKEYRSELVKVVNEQDPKVALEKLIIDVPSVKVVQENCHSFTHAIGNAALVKFNNDIPKSIE